MRFFGEGGGWGACVRERAIVRERERESKSERERERERKLEPVCV